MLSQSVSQSVWCQVRLDLLVAKNFSMYLTYMFSHYIHQNTVNIYHVNIKLYFPYKAFVSPGFVQPIMPYFTYLML